MKNQRELADSAEAMCQRLGDLASLASSVEAWPPGTRQWTAIEDRLDRARRVPAQRRRWATLAVAATLVLCTAGWLIARRPLGYRLEGCRLAVDGDLETTAVHGGTIAFDDGSQATVEKDARFRLAMLPFGRGAEINLDEGEALLAVVHRSRARWAVLAGPFRVDVTGTRFGVRWSRERGQFRLTMQEGEVRIAGGPIPPDTRVRAGQTVIANLVGGTFEIANEHASAGQRVGEAAPARTAPVRSDQASVASPRPPLPSTSPHRRLSPPQRLEHRSASAPRSAVTPPEPSAPVNVVAPVPTEVPLLQAPTMRSARSDDFPASDEGKPTSLRVVIGQTGQLANGLSGATWIASGDGATFSSPTSWEGRTHLVPDAGLLCTSGTLAGLACVNEGLPQMTCNWDSNWGVAIGWHTRADQKAWGDEAAGGIAVEFRGRAATYRLNAHLKGDPSARIYCIENYKSGQVVRPSMFKSECWFDKGDTLEDFTRVDVFNLQFSSGMSYVAFRYCISAITLFP